MATLIRKHSKKHAKGHADHVDAWLMSYADMITLLFMFFVILVAYAATDRKQETQQAVVKGEVPHPYIPEHSGTLSLRTPYDEAYRKLTGIAATSGVERSISIERTARGVTIDISAVQFFGRGSAEIADEELPLLKNIAETLNDAALSGDPIEVAGYTDDTPPENSRFSNNWELAAMRAVHVVNALAGEGIDPSRLHAASYAAGSPLVPNLDSHGKPIAENRDRNQRIVITLEHAPDAPKMAEISQNWPKNWQMASIK